MTHLPPDLPDPEQPGPTIWAAREIRRVDDRYEVGAFRGHATPGSAWAAVAMIALVALALIGAMFAWAVQ